MKLVKCLTHDGREDEDLLRLPNDKSRGDLVQLAAAVAVGPKRGVRTNGDRTAEARPRNLARWRARSQQSISLE